MGPSPVFLQKPRNVTENLYQTVYFRCQAIGFPKPTIKWVKYNNSSGNQETVVKTNYGRFVIGMNGYLFILMGVEYSDSGRYACIAQNTNGRIIAYAHLSVTGKIPCLKKQKERTNKQTMVAAGTNKF